MSCRSYCLFVAIGLSLLLSTPRAQSQVAPKTEKSQTQTALPTTEIFMNLLGTCAAGMNLQIGAKLIGSVKEFYEGQKTEGSAFLENAPDLLKLFPDTDKIVAYRLYLDCILKIVGAPKEEANGPKKEVCINVFLECAADLKKTGSSSEQSCKRYAECDPKNAKAHMVLAQSLIENRNPTAAKESLEKARTLEPNNSGVLAASYENLARVSIEERRYPQAYRYALMSIELNKKANNSLRLGRNYTTLGYVEGELGNYRAMRIAFERSITLLERTNDKLSLARGFRLYGRALAREGNRTLGCAYLLKARALFIQLGEAQGRELAERGLDMRC
jgi:tetratricopeptide (TPR) repeat protein